MLTIKQEEAEAAINEILEQFERPQEVQIIDSVGECVGYELPSVNSPQFYDIFSPLSYPDIYEALRGTVILMIGETHVRLFDSLDAAMEFGKDLNDKKVIINGPFKTELTLEELEGR